MRKGCVCQQCGRVYQMDLLIPDELWLKISPKKSEGGLLCPQCIVRSLEKMFGFSAFHLTREPELTALREKLAAAEALVEAIVLHTMTGKEE